MKMRSTVRVAWTFASLFFASSVANAQCDGWSKGFENGSFGPALFSNNVGALLSFDDGGGPVLYAAGGPTNIAQWNGSDWRSLASGVNQEVTALGVYDDGSGAALYAGGFFTTAGGAPASKIAKWDGASWSALGGGVNDYVRGLIAYDDGSGTKLYACGGFTIAGGASASRVARWDGNTWSAVGAGLPGPTNALAAFDDGSGLALYAAGRLAQPGNPGFVYKWDGAIWTQIGAWSGLGGQCCLLSALQVFDDGTGPALYAGGSIPTSRWDGNTWTEIGSGIDQVLAFEVFDDGSGPALFAGGHFTTIGGVAAYKIAKWDGTNWNALGDGVHSITNPNEYVRALAVYDDDSGIGPRLYVGGVFQQAGDVLADAVARWDGVEWKGVFAHGDGLGGTTVNTVIGLDDAATCMKVHDDGSGLSLFVGGGFYGSGETYAPFVARWDGAHWHALGVGLNYPVEAFAVYDDGAGPKLYAGGRFTESPGTLIKRIARWDGTSWSDVGGGASGEVYALATYDLGSGEELYAGGLFGMLGGAPAASLGRWNGSTWSALGPGSNGTVYALLGHDDGSGPAIYVGGEFTSPGTRVARWNGSAWSMVGLGFNSSVRALCEFDDGSGAELYAGGLFTSSGGVPVLSIAKWNGVAWSAVGGGLNGAAYALSVFDDGAGPALYAAGNFTTAGGASANGVAKWDGTQWSALGLGMNVTATRKVLALEAFDDGTGGGADLYAAGSFTQADNLESSYIARFGECRPGVAFCFGDGLDRFVETDCPCGNFGASGRGCANSNSSLGGAKLSALGTTIPNTVVFTCTGIPNNNLCTFLRSSASVESGSVFGDGIKCLTGSVIRFGSQTSGQGGNESNSVASGTATIAFGNTRDYQLHYRNPTAGFCPPDAFNISNGYRIAW